MSRATLPAELTTFALDCVGSPDALELLSLMVDAPERWWDSSTASQELGVSAGSARSLCETLARHNLLDIRITEAVRYRFHPGTPEIERLAQALVAEYRRNPVLLVRLLRKGTPRSLIDFANAFRLRR